MAGSKSSNSNPSQVVEPFFGVGLLVLLGKSGSGSVSPINLVLLSAENITKLTSHTENK
jgi:hypothetical protein